MGHTHDEAMVREMADNAPGPTSIDLDLGTTEGERVFAHVKLRYDRNGSKPAGLPALWIGFDTTPVGKRRGLDTTTEHGRDLVRFPKDTFGFDVQFIADV